MSGPIRVLELRSVRGTGGGPEKTILLGATRADPDRTRVTVAYIRDMRDPIFGIDAWASSLNIDYTEIRERHSFDPAIWGPLRSLVRDRGIQIVHGHDYKTNLLALMLARRTGVTPMTTAHGWAGNTRRERCVYYPADKWIAGFFRRVIAVSSDLRREILRWGARPEHVTTILNGIDPEAFRRNPGRRDAVRAALGLSDGDVVVGSVGRMTRAKRFDLLLEAVALSRTTVPSLRVVLVGEGEERAALEAASQRLGLGDRCAFLGHRTDIADLHNAFDVFVQSSDYEGTPNAVLEAMALETPIVATDTGGTRELTVDGIDGLLVPTGNPAALAHALLTVLEDPAGAAVRVRNARLRVERTLSFDARTRRLEDIYRALIQDCRVRVAA